MNRNGLKVKIMKAKLKLFEKKCDPYLFTKILREEGICVGEHTIFYDPFSQRIDRERPWMLKIGDYCKITHGVIILTHDYSRSVLRRVYGDIVGEAKVTSIGNNVFIGMNSIILMGAHIGNNVIVGAGSVVSGDIPDNVVVAGNPAKVIRTLDEHYRNRKSRTIEEAKLYANEFFREYKRCPNEQEMGCFFPLFLERSEKELEKHHIRTKLNGDNEQEVISDFMKTEPTFVSFKEFLQECGLNGRDL